MVGQVGGGTKNAHRLECIASSGERTVPPQSVNNPRRRKKGKSGVCGSESEYETRKQLLEEGESTWREGMEGIRHKDENIRRMTYQNKT